MGIDQPELVPLAFAAGYTVNGHFNNTRGTCRARGFIEYTDGGRTRLTPLGRSLAETSDIEPTDDGIQGAVMKRLDSAGRRLLSVLLKSYPEALSNEDLAGASSYTVNGHFNNVRGKLRSLGLVRYESGKTVAENFLFPES
jgi:hypothetical protein